ncbi:hypothetical protein [Halobacillus sp. Cin3]|uniref:hypothetical protein n=1 Tax=Halobacillus sp. Cin3 TaxID=2928441 RepID=UPI00248E3282|nr:hypothetical protein [Halobacillus sp. Cin3]
MRLNNYVTPTNDAMQRFRIPLNHFKIYATFMERNILEEQYKALDIEEDRDTTLEDELDNPFQETWTHFLSEKHMFSVQFPSILRSSLLISIYSFLENQLIRLCKELQESRDLSIKVNNINNKGIEKAKIYLKNVVGIDFPTNSKEWQDIKRYQYIRNNFAHSEGILDSNDKNLLLAIATLDAVDIMGDDFLGKNIILYKSFIPTLIETVEGFLSKIESQYLELLYPHHYLYKGGRSFE